MNFLSDIFFYNPEKPLLFTQLYFWVFLAVLMLFYSFLYKKNPLRNAYLFVLSLFFYYKSGGYFFSLLIFSTLVDFYIGQGIYHANKKSIKKLFVALSITVNLSLLAYFKYAYFFTKSINQIFGLNLEIQNALALWSNNLFSSGFDVSSIILPVGISFYTFQTISYSIDLYRGKLEKPVNSIIDFGFYVSFFPQLVAGPIVRASEFIPQLYKKYELSKAEFNTAIFLILNGLIKKVLISDYISVNFVDRIFASPEMYSGFENLLAVYGYGIQIYCDFSGYTDIAIGVALLLGFRLPLNFNSPYKAVNITDFWRRWHISLSSWLRDYLYISLGGNRKGKIRTYINLFITMLLGGLWHGAAIRFIIWGALHGVGLAFHKMWLQFFPSNGKSGWFSRFISIFITFHFVHFAWIFFRASDMSAVGLMLNQIAFDFRPELIFSVLTGYWRPILLMFIGFAIHWLPVGTKDFYKEQFIRIPAWAKVGVTTIIVFGLYQVTSAGVQAFIYFQF
ncbi:MAG: MBOAT family protein [Bacteroidales bacterium]|nr:MBOAT family protein [Bacteroidales bacterium]